MITVKKCFGDSAKNGSYEARTESKVQTITKYAFENKRTENKLWIGFYSMNGRKYAKMERKKFEIAKQRKNIGKKPQQE